MLVLFTVTAACVALAATWGLERLCKGLIEDPFV